MPDINRDPVRKIALPFAGDPWAQPRAQVPIPDDVQRLVVTSAPMLIRVVGYDGTGPLASPVDGADATYDYTTVKLRSDRRGNETLVRTQVVSAMLAGDTQITEEEVSPAEVLCLGLPLVVAGTTPALWVFVDSGARYSGGFNGTS